MLCGGAPPLRNTSSHRAAVTVLPEAVIVSFRWSMYRPLPSESAIHGVTNCCPRRAKDLPGCARARHGQKRCIPAGCRYSAHLVRLVFRQILGQGLNDDHARHAEARRGFIWYLVPLRPLLCTPHKAVRSKREPLGGQRCVLTPLCCVRCSSEIGSPCWCAATPRVRRSRRCAPMTIPSRWWKAARGLNCPALRFLGVGLVPYVANEQRKFGPTGCPRVIFSIFRGQTRVRSLTANTHTNVFVSTFHRSVTT